MMIGKKTTALNIKIDSSKQEERHECVIDIEGNNRASMVASVVQVLFGKLQEGV